MSESSSKKVVTFAVALAIIVATAVILLSRRSRLPTDPVTKAAVSSMVGDLRGLMMAEQATRMIRGRYSADAADAGHISSPGVTAPVIVLADTGWSATVGFKTIPELKCAVAVHNRNPLKRFAKSGEIVCE
jgi:hypothetical protein